MDFSKYSTAQLCVLIREASRELESRLPKANYTVAVAPPEPDELPTIDKPNNAELKHVEGCIRLLSRGGVIRANDVHEYRRIYKQYPDYMRLRGLPDDLRGSSAKRYLDFNREE